MTMPKFVWFKEFPGSKNWNGFFASNKSGTRFNTAIVVFITKLELGGYKMECNASDIDCNYQYLWEAKACGKQLAIDIWKRWNE